MKLLYIAPVRIDLDKMDGVGKKVMAHAKFFSSQYEVVLLCRDANHVVLYNNGTDKKKAIMKAASKMDILKAAYRIVDYESIDVCYIRYSKSDPFFLRLLKRMKQKGLQIVIEIPTYPYDEEGKETLRGRVTRFVDILYRNKLKNYVDRIVTYSDDKQIFGIETIRTINGFDFSKVKVSKAIDKLDTIHMCGVANMYRVHGYDRIIEGLKQYYANGGKRDIVFDVVGGGDNSTIAEYKSLAHSANLDDRICFHGRLHGEKLDAVYDLATLGVNSLAIHRQNLKNESTLKTREYAAKGLPILSSSYVDAFSRDDNNRYVCMVPPDESPIDIQKVINFCDSLYQNADIELLRNTIRAKARTICDMPVTLKPVTDFFNERR